MIIQAEGKFVGKMFLRTIGKIIDKKHTLRHGMTTSYAYFLIDNFIIGFIINKRHISAIKNSPNWTIKTAIGLLPFSNAKYDTGKIPNNIIPVMD